MPYETYETTAIEKTASEATELIADKQVKDSWRPSPYALIRLPGKSYREFGQLVLADTVLLVSEIITLKQRIETTRNALSDALYAYIGEHATVDNKSRLVALRRDIFNERALTDDDYAFIAEHMGQEYVESIKYYLSECADLMQCMEKARATFEREVGDKRALFQESIRDENFLKSIILSQPILYEKYRMQYIKTDPRNTKTQERRTEDKLFRYFTRMTTKTSPFGRFGGVARLNYGSTTQGSVRALSFLTQVQFNQEAASYLVQKLSRLPEFQPFLYPQLNNSALIDTEKITFLSGKVIESRTTLASSATLRSGPAQPAMRAIFNLLLQKHDGQLTLEQFIALVRTTLTSNAEQGEKLVQLAFNLIKSGLIINEFRFVSNKATRLQMLHEQISQLNTPNSAAIAEQLAQVIALVERYPTLSLNEQYEATQEATRRINELAVWGSKPAMPVEYADFFLEDTVFDGVDVTLSNDFFAAIQDDIDLILDTITARDQGSYGFQTVRDTFTEMYGTGGQTSALDFAYRYTQLSSSGNPYSKEKGRGRAWRSRLDLFMERLVTASFPNGDSVGDPTRQQNDVLEVFRELAAEYMKESSAVTQAPQSVVLMLQIAARSWDAVRDGDFLLVINTMMPGFGHFFSRYCYLYERFQNELPWDLAQEIRESLVAYQAALNQTANTETEVVEILSALNNNAQVHEPLTHRHIVLPLESSDLPRERQIGAQELSLRHDVTTDELILSARDGKQLQPMYMGFFHVMALPGLHRILTDMSPSGYHIDHLKPSVYPYFKDMKGENRQGVYYFPRLQVGRIVFQRAMWVVETKTLRKLVDSRDPFQTFFNFLEWAEQNKLPRQLFIRTNVIGFQAGKATAQADSATNGTATSETPATVPSQHEAAAQPDANGQAGNQPASQSANQSANQQSQPDWSSLFSGQHKPVLIDLENYFTVRQLTSMLEDTRSQYIWCEEMFPAPDDLFLHDDNGAPYVFELQLQFDKGLAAVSDQDDKGTQQEG